MSTVETSEITKVTAAKKLFDLYTYWGRRQTPGDDPGMDLLRDLYDGWGQFATEAEDVSFKTVNEDGVRGIWAKPGAHRPGAILYIHGGGYLGGSSNSHRKLAAHIAKAAGLPVLVLDYRLAPEHPYPAALDDSLAAYEWILSKGVSPSRVAVVGDSAGGSLATAVALHRRDHGKEVPGAVVAMSPFYDIGATGKSFDIDPEKDAIATDKSTIGGLQGLVFGPGISLENPYINALAADPTGLPPLHIAFGGDENLLSGGEDFAELARSKGVDVEFEVFPDQQHVFQVLAGVDDDADASIEHIGQFIRRHLP